MILVNIGLHVKGADPLTPRQVVAAISREGIMVQRYAVRQSASEPTLVAQLHRALTGNEAYWLAVILDQEAIAQQTADGEGQLHGPKAEEWGPFNPDFFLTFEEVSL